MTTYLIASNEMMCRILARRMEGQDISMPVRWHAPDWLLDTPDAKTRAATIDNPDASEAVPDAPVDMAVVDCSGVEGDPRALLDRVREQLSPRRWLVLSDSLDAALMVYAAQIGASGCLAVPAPIELVCAAAALVWAGGQCFPRAALAMLRAQPRHAGAAPVSHLHPYPHPHSADGTTATG
ncbi:hypothetical protein LMG19282_00325 [Cupriavidus campinensis]|uniref:DNA-binding response regulator n=1 Tax=Cupriavidus campinensis TaxID=151783 RepID=A0AAE9L4X1_9BURK|nr:MULTISPECIES: DNA-binding response regulator [Cupriavidus]URF07091.1 DNA-binding response regulator [Cupriavidus campinensis]CAG2131030.1 hypothetical protein LMG19282_00325 [Cupriavidus campinensis]